MQLVFGNNDTINHSQRHNVSEIQKSTKQGLTRMKYSMLSGARTFSIFVCICVC